MSYEECFMCKKNNRNILLDIAFVNLKTKMPSSQKPTATVLEHLASCLKMKLILCEDTTVCNECYDELAEYDALMVQLMKNQKILTNKLQTILRNHAKSASVVNFYKEEIEMDNNALKFEDEINSELEDAFNPELDTKEELVEGEEIIVDTADEIVENSSIVGDEIIVDSNDYVDSDGGYIIAEVIDENGIVMQQEESEENLTEDDEVTIVQPNYNYVEMELDNATFIKPRYERECPHCGETFKTKMLLRNHVMENHKINIFACKICGVQRKDEEYLELHMNVHHGKTEFECRYCDKRFSRPVNTLRHMRKHWDKKGYQCEKCGERFSLDNMLYNHKKRHEAEENPLICSICNQSFKSIKTYNHHQLIHQENRPRHQCPICPKSFTERYTLKMHMNIHPSVQEMEDAKKYEENTCVICEASFLTKDELINHLKMTHNII